VTPESAFDCLRVGWFTWKDVRDGQTGQKVRRQMAPLETPTNLPPNVTRDISAALTALLADVFALCLKTKKFHWHILGRHFRDYHLLLDGQGELENWIDEAERRTWFLYEATRRDDNL
jgi:hypothetical protein